MALYTFFLCPYIALLYSSLSVFLVYLLSFFFGCHFLHLVCLLVSNCIFFFLSWSCFFFFLSDVLVCLHRCFHICPIFFFYDAVLVDVLALISYAIVFIRLGLHVCSHLSFLPVFYGSFSSDLLTFISYVSLHPSLSLSVFLFSSVARVFIFRGPSSLLFLLSILIFLLFLLHSDVPQ